MRSEAVVGVGGLCYVWNEDSERGERAIIETTIRGRRVLPYHSVTATPTTPQAVAILIKVPGDRADQQISGTLRLLDADGQAVEAETSPGKKEPIENEFELEVGRPPSLEHERMIDAAMVLNIGPIPLPLGRYQWRLDMNGQTEIVSFTVTNC